MLAVRTPEAPQATCTLARPAIPPSPLRDRVGHSDHDRFRGYFPVHFIPAYNLPVYASQWPLPDTTQDSVRGCSLGFTAAAISGDRLQRACKAQPVQDPVVTNCPACKPPSERLPILASHTRSSTGSTAEFPPIVSQTRVPLMTK